MEEFQSEKAEEKPISFLPTLRQFKMKKKKIKERKRKIKVPIDTRKHCPKCGSLDISILSCGTIVCHNKYCLTLTVPDTETKK